MGALVASFSHEPHRSLTDTLLRVKLMQVKLALAHHARRSLDVAMLNTVLDAIVNDTQRAADIIRKLRNLFRMSKGEYTDVLFAP